MSQEVINILLQNGVEIVVAIVGLVISYYVIPAIKNDLVPWLKEKHLYDIVYKGVLAAEKLANTGQIKKVDKKQYVINYLVGKGVSVTPEVRLLIESACTELDNIEAVAYEAIMNDK